MQENIYDNQSFFERYSEMLRSKVVFICSVDCRLV